MYHKINHFAELIILTITISWQPLFGCVSAILASSYYIAMLKMNVVNKNHGGSWKAYFKSILNQFK